MDNNLNFENNSSEPLKNIQQSDVQTMKDEMSSKISQVPVAPTSQDMVQQTNQSNNAFVQNVQTQSHQNNNMIIVFKILSILLFAVIIIFIVIPFLKNIINNNGNDNNDKGTVETEKNNISEEIQKSILITDIVTVYKAAATQYLLESMVTNNNNYYCYYYYKDNNNIIDESNECKKINSNIKNDVSCVIILNKESYITQIVAISDKYKLDIKKYGILENELAEYIEATNNENKKIYVGGNNSEYTINIK